MLFSTLALSTNSLSLASSLGARAATGWEAFFLSNGTEESDTMTICPRCTHACKGSPRSAPSPSHGENRKRNRVSFSSRLFLEEAEVGIESGFELVRKFFSRDASGLSHGSCDHHARGIGSRAEISQRSFRGGGRAASAAGSGAAAAAGLPARTAWPGAAVRWLPSPRRWRWGRFPAC